MQAEILCEYADTIMPNGNTIRSPVKYRWKGPKTAPVPISMRFLDSEGLSTLPWPLKQIEKAAWMDGGLYVRTDTGWGQSLWLYYRVRSLWNGWGYVLKLRILLTLQVWGLARCKSGVMVSWRNIGLKKGRK